MRRAIYPGTFDPPHRGHLDLIRRGRELVDELVVAVAVNRAKDALFTQDERVALLRTLTEPWTGVRVEALAGLVVDLYAAEDAQFLLRGIRTFSDFESEYSMAITNRDLRGGAAETVFVIPSPEYAHYSSRRVKEVASFGGDVRAFIPEAIQERVLTRLAAWRREAESSP